MPKVPKVPPADADTAASGASEPFYREIAHSLRGQLLEGNFRPGQRFFTIRFLIRSTGRSLPTIRSALALLVDEGLLEARPGSGYYVTDNVTKNSPKGFLNLLTVIPSYVSPKEPWFTGRLVSGMIHAVEKTDALVSFYQRQIIFPDKMENVLLQGPVTDEDTVRWDEERILATRPDGIAWIHSSHVDIPLLRFLDKKGIPIVTTIRRLPEVNLPLVREDDIVFASMLLSQLQAHGHRHIGFIVRSLEDEYFGSKMAAIHAVKKSLAMSIEPTDLFFLMPELVPMEEYVANLGKFLDARPQLTALVILASSGIYPLITLMQTRPSERLDRLSIIYNVLDGVRIPEVPKRASLARISPPLEQLGEHLARSLIARIRNEPMPEQPVLIPVFEQGDSLRRI